MSEKSTEILILFKHVYTDDNGDAHKASDGEDAPDIEAAQEWIANKMEEYPAALPEAFRVTDSAGNVLPVSIVPPQSGYVVTIGAPAGKTRKGKSSADGYKACSKGDECKGKEPDPVKGDGSLRPGNAYRIKTGGLCRTCHEAAKAAAATVGGNAGGGKGGKGKGK